MTGKRERSSMCRMILTCSSWGVFSNLWLLRAIVSNLAGGEGSLTLRCIGAFLSVRTILVINSGYKNYMTKISHKASILLTAFNHSIMISNQIYQFLLWTPF